MRDEVKITNSLNVPNNLMFKHEKLGVCALETMHVGSRCLAVLLILEASVATSVNQVHIEFRVFCCFSRLSVRPQEQVSILVSKLGMPMCKIKTYLFL